MPLPKCNTRSSYKAILYTFGPYQPDDKEAARERVFKVFTQYVGRNLKPGEFTCAFEESEEGYHHCHVAVGFITEQKPNMGLVTALKGLCTATEDRAVNLGMNYVPRATRG